MYISPINIIKGIHGVLQANKTQIDRVIKYYRSTDELHIFDGLRKTLPESAYPSLELEPASASIEWTHTSAQTGEYNIDCYLTIKNSNEELNAEYVSEVSRVILKILNYPDNMSFVIPNEYYPNGNDPEHPFPIHIQFANVQNVTYKSTSDGAITVVQFTWTGRVLEYFEYNGDGPHEITWKHDILPGEENSTIN